MTYYNSNHIFQEFCIYAWWNSRSCPHCLSPISLFNITESIIRSIQDPPIWDLDSDDTRRSTTLPSDRRTDHVATTPLMSDDDHHHIIAAASLVSWNYRICESDDTMLKYELKKFG
ncbi:Zinc finger, RING/FYVE/PHD-type [Parasponia andersonii]|uniref:Zinc finger, RING/FYVE/PHD-type n=1 Tax=Parasponia andersonii TaxID=3476 RepID=A0A2P5BI66_PARAD|nr:Zinc finger, RING/FYVE/PHD-type [Parasponia andersonii]